MDDPVMVVLPIDQLTDRQLHVYHIQLLAKQEETFNRMDRFMADLAASVAALQGAVDTMAVRFNAQNSVLTAALAEATSALDALQVEDATAKQALADALANASAAAEEIDANVSELNSIGANPEVPVEDVPVEELPDAPDPGDQSTNQQPTA